MCGDFLFLDIHALIISKKGSHANIHNLHINEQWKGRRGEGLCIDEGFFVGSAILAILSSKETFNSGPAFYGVSAGTKISTKFISKLIVVYCQ
jgi:hypothetical protein